MVKTLSYGMIGLLFVTSGCAGPLADARFNVSQKFHVASERFADVTEAFAVNADKVAQTKFKNQAELQQTEIGAWLRESANPETGKIEATPEEFMVNVTTILDARDVLAKDRERWTSVHGDLVEMLTLFRTINASTMETEAAIHEAEKSVQEFTRKVTEVLGVLAIAGAAAL